MLGIQSIAVQTTGQLLEVVMISTLQIMQMPTQVAIAVFHIPTIMAILQIKHHIPQYVDNQTDTSFKL
jgi:hypothetical protein